MENAEKPIGLRMEDIAHHIIDITENSLNAGANTIIITITDQEKPGYLTLIIEDNGKGMDPEIVFQAPDPFFTTRTTRKVGVGLSFLKQAAELAGGSFALTSSPGKGTRVKTEFKMDHIDMPPLGDIPSALKDLLITHPEVRWVISYNLQGETATLDTCPPELNRDSRSKNDAHKTIDTPLKKSDITLQGIGD
ncbi:MAG: ATP-binding protein [bacterium]